MCSDQLNTFNDVVARFLSDALPMLRDRRKRLPVLANPILVPRCGVSGAHNAATSGLFHADSDRTTETGGTLLRSGS